MSHWFQSDVSSALCSLNNEQIQVVGGSNFKLLTQLSYIKKHKLTMVENDLFNIFLMTVSQVLIELSQNRASNSKIT